MYQLSLHTGAPPSNEFEHADYRRAEFDSDPRDARPVVFHVKVGDKRAPHITHYAVWCGGVMLDRGPITPPCRPPFEVINLKVYGKYDA